MSSGDNNQGSSPSDSQPSSSSDRPRRGNFYQDALSHLSANKIDAILMATRLSTLVFSILYLLPFFNGHSAFKKAIIANAATSALRLHQRLPGVQLSREFFGQLIAEDSAHYLLFSLIFLYSQPITLVLLPIFLFALLHLSGNALVLLDKTGTRTTQYGVLLSQFVEKYQKSILQTVAVSEIFLMPVVVMGVLGGQTSLMTPFVYYRFLSFRYASRRNPYTRQSFRQLRVTTEGLTQFPQCPQFVRNICYRAIDILCRLAPATVSSQYSSLTMKAAILLLFVALATTTATSSSQPKQSTDDTAPDSNAYEYDVPRSENGIMELLYPDEYLALEDLTGSEGMKLEKRGCLRRGGSCDGRPQDCCPSSSCRCNLWGVNCRCSRQGLFQKWGR
ncbi:Transmembrane protein 33 [Halotydeus destructor]|nr:Transmembrane protein 33 [Halotydeus destructor]